MMRPFIRACSIALALLLGEIGPLLAQSIPYRAQGHYYSAKQAYQSGRFAESIDYVLRSKEALGGTNRELQYLHVMSAWGAKRYHEAQKELETFFSIEEKTMEEKRFHSSVDRLTSDEVKALTMLINRIDETVASEDAKAADAADLSGRWVLATPPGNLHGERLVTVVVDGDILRAASPDTRPSSFTGEPDGPRMQMFARRGEETANVIHFTNVSFHYTYIGVCDGKRFEAQSMNVYPGRDGFRQATLHYDKTSRVFRLTAGTQSNPGCQMRHDGPHTFEFRRDQAGR